MKNGQKGKNDQKDKRAEMTNREVDRTEKRERGHKWQKDKRIENIRWKSKNDKSTKKKIIKKKKEEEKKEIEFYISFLFLYSSSFSSFSFLPFIIVFIYISKVSQINTHTLRLSNKKLQKHTEAIPFGPMPIPLGNFGDFGLPAGSTPVIVMASSASFGDFIWIGEELVTSANFFSFSTVLSTSATKVEIFTADILSATSL